MATSTERARNSTRAHKYRLCVAILHEARRCVDLAGNPIRIVDPLTARTASRRKHHIRA